MKKALVILMAFLFAALVFGCSSAVSDTDDGIMQTTTPEIKTGTDFRNAAWGMSADEVIATEGHQPDDKEKDAILYTDKEVAGLDAAVLFQFNSDQLISGSYIIKEVHTNENAYIDDYNQLKEALISKYGEPTVDQIVWKDELYKDDPSEYGFAVSLGDLIYATSWPTQTGEIGLVLSGDNFEISLTVLYRSDEAIDLSKQANTTGL